MVCFVFLLDFRTIPAVWYILFFLRNLKIFVKYFGKFSVFKTVHYVCAQPFSGRITGKYVLFYLLYYKYKDVTPSVSLSPLLTNEEVEVGFRAE